MPSRDHSPIGDTGQNEFSESITTSNTSAQNYRYHTSSSSRIDSSSDVNFTSFERFEKDQEQGKTGKLDFNKSIWNVNDGEQFNHFSSQNDQSSTSGNNQNSHENFSIQTETGQNESEQQVIESGTNEQHTGRSVIEQTERSLDNYEASGRSVVEQITDASSSGSAHAEQYMKSISEGYKVDTEDSEAAVSSSTTGQNDAQATEVLNDLESTARSQDSTAFTDHNTDGSGLKQDDRRIVERDIPEQVDQDPFEEASERTPLLHRDSESNEDLYNDESTTKKRTRWPSFIALGILCVAVILAIIFGFAAPAAVEEYAKEAITFEPGNVSVESFTTLGLQARAQGVFYFDGSKVEKTAVRNIGRFATWLAKEVEIDQGEARVYLAEYNNSLLGTAKIPSIKINIQNGHENYLDVLSSVEPGDLSRIRSLALDFMDGKQTLDVNAVVSADVKSGILTLGRKTITSAMTFKRSGNTTLPTVHITNLLVGEYGIPGHPEGIVARANISTFNKYPVRFNVPPIAFDVLLKDCSSKPLLLATMNTELIHVDPKADINTTVTGYMREMPTNLTQTCPDSDESPLDEFIGSYLAGEETQIFVSGGKQDPERTPGWIGGLLSDMVLPVPVPPRTGFNHIIKNFSLSNVHFSLPKYGADASPLLSAIVNVIVGLPEHIDVNVSVDRVRADADMYYKGKKLGVLDLQKWQDSNSSIVNKELRVQSVVQEAPLKITDQDVFTEVLSSMIFGGGGLTLEVRAKVDVRTTTVLGQFVVRKIPSNSTFTIKAGTNKIEQKVKDISVVGSSPEELIMQTRVEVKNPTDYSASIPYVNVSIWCNGTRLGYVWGSFDMKPGLNELVVDASYLAGPVGTELLSQYISGRNTSMTIKTHNGSLPGLPDPKLSIDVPMPHMFGKFMKEATMHIFSSSVTFVLFSPLQMLITSINAHAYYNGTDIGAINYEKPIEVHVGENETPSLPVDWNFNGGFKLIKDALGGTLKLDAHADVGVRIGEWQQRLWYEGKGMGAKIKFFMEAEDDI